MFFKKNHTSPDAHKAKGTPKASIAATIIRTDGTVDKLGVIARPEVDPAQAQAIINGGTTL